MLVKCRSPCASFHKKKALAEIFSITSSKLWVRLVDKKHRLLTAAASGCRTWLELRSAACLAAARSLILCMTWAEHATEGQFQAVQTAAGARIVPRQCCDICPSPGGLRKTLVCFLQMKAQQQNCCVQKLPAREAEAQIPSSATRKTTS